MKSPQFFKKYMILITIICVSKHSTAIANKTLGSTTRHTIPITIFDFVGAKKKKGRGCGGPRQDAHGDKKLFFFSALHWGQCFTEPCKTYVCDAKPCICSTIIITVLVYCPFLPTGLGHAMSLLVFERSCATSSLRFYLPRHFFFNVPILAKS